MITSESIAQTRPKKEQHAIDSTSKEIPVSASPISPKRGATNSDWSFLSLDACAIETYLHDHPTYDGRGTIIAILDDGVDPGIDGLTKTSEGKTKIIDVQDFGGSGDLFWESASRDGDRLTLNGKSVLSGLDKITITPYDGLYYYAVLHESRFKNGLADINFDGSKTNDFGVLIFQDSRDHWSAIVDGNADGSLADEPLLSNYKEHQDLFKFRSSAEGADKDERFLSGAVNIFPAEHRINLYFADGGHGTHVAGIAGGYRIDGQTGFNGVAPGAEMIALKFSDNTIDGVTVSNSMKRAYEYVIKVAQESGKPVIVNMSFGIGSELEGRSIMDVWLDSLLDAHPEVTVCISAGNDGPGLSNIGLPGSARTVITSGACLPDDTGRDLYGIKMSQPIIWDFSSRGAELEKPDIVSPGTAISTVPDYVLGDRYNGTSMSSPYTTGCCALLISGMRQAFPDYTPVSNDIKLALRSGATHFAGAMPVDEGGGLINVPRSFSQLADWQKRHFHPRKYTISVPVPSSVGRGTAAFYRNGIFPINGKVTTFTVSPLTGNTIKTRERLLGFNAYKLRATAPWLEAVQSSVYHRGDGSFQIGVSYDPKQLQNPGVYSAKILGYEKGALESSPPEFELWNTVVVPYILSPENFYRAEIKDIRLRSGSLERTFFRMPPAVRAVKISLSSVDPNVVADAVIINDDGRTFSQVHLNSNDHDEESASRLITGEDISRGVWEIVIRRGLGSEDELLSKVTLKVEAVPFDIQFNGMTMPSGSAASGNYEITNSGANVLEIESSHADLSGYEKNIDTSITIGDAFEYNFKAGPKEKSVTFDFALAREDYNLFTDISFQILKADGSAIVNGGFDLRNARAKCDFSNNDTNSYTLKFRGGLADPIKPHSFRLRIRERRELELKNKYDISGAEIIPASQTLNPGQTEYCRINSREISQVLPKNYSYYGELSLKTNVGRIRIPISFAP
ncbi:MAG: S8 family serine peptidase [Ignavibacteriota bacterium]